ncbi:MAG TPA: zf-HC2 domain-containing protein [Candidatus Hydrogenedentes bacterium]|nr:zf-HC2 domain-containing protein [Candidatus Hydrogenedentota bacterium]
MNCTEIHDEFSALLDGELSGEARVRIEAHIAKCEDCRRALDKMKRVDAMYRALDPLTAPAGFEKPIQAAIREKHPGQVQTARPAWRWRLAWAAAAACAAIVVAVGILRREPDTERFNVASIEQKSEPSEPRRIVQEHDAGKWQTAPTMDTAVPMALPSPSPTESTGDQGPESMPFKDLAVSIPQQSAAKESRKDEASESAPIAPPPADRESRKAKMPASESAAAPPPAERETGKAKMPASAPVTPPSSPVEIPPPSIAAERNQDDLPVQTALVPPESAAPASVDNEEAIDAGHDPARKKKAIADELVMPTNKLGFGAITIGSGLKKTDKRYVGMAAPLENDKRDMAVPEKTNTAKDVSPDRGDRKIVVERAFLRIGDAWVEDGYPQDAPTRILRRGSKACKAFFDKHSELKPLLELDGRIVFSFDKRWYRIEPAKKSD